MKTSLIITVLNEEQSIRVLLDSIKNQTKKADEIIIIDAGSTDKTQTIIKSHPLKPTLIIKKGFNRSKARNLGINQAKHEVIAVTDGGCILDKQWLEQITKPFKNKSVKAVAGFYQVEAGTILQKSMAPFIAVMPDQFNFQTYLPSSRSLAFKKTAFFKIGQYPENLNYCEDLIFAHDLKTKTKMIVEPKAIVTWRLPNSILSLFHQIKNYAFGDIKAKFIPHQKKILSIYLRYLIFLITPFTFPLYLLFTIIKFYYYIKHPLALFYLPIIRVTVDSAMIFGSLKGKIEA